MIIAVLTDFGSSDNYNGVMEAVIKRINPKAEISYISRNAKNFNIISASYLLYTSYKYFPPHTIFLTVVDPGVGSSRRPLLIKTKHYYFIGPDNGVLYWSVTNDGVKEIRVIDNEKLFLENRISNTFHGRDIFSVTAVFKSLGVDDEIIGTEIREIVPLGIKIEQLQLPKTCMRVIHVDHYGNMALNVRAENIEHYSFKLIYNGKTVKLRTARTFSDGREMEDLLIYLNGYGFLEIGINKGSASDRLGLKEGDEICLEVSTQEDSSHSI